MGNATKPAIRLPGTTKWPGIDIHVDGEAGDPQLTLDVKITSEGPKHAKARR